jgi:hypothetical protein
LALCGSTTSLNSAVETFRELREITMDKGHIDRALLLLKLLVPEDPSVLEEDPLVLVRNAAAGQ